MLWWKLVHGVLGLYIERTCWLELDHHGEVLGLSLERYISPSNFSSRLPPDRGIPLLPLTLT